MTALDTSILSWRVAARRVLAAMEKQLERPGWQYRGVFLAWLLATLFACPSIYEFRQGDWWQTQQAGIQKIEHPLRDMSDWPPESTQSKRTFRITVPLIAHILRLNIVGVYVLQWVCGFLLLALVLQMAANWFQDRVTAFLATLYLAAVYPGSSAFLEYWNLFDTFAYLFLALAVYFSAPALVGLLVLAAAYTDERALIASPVVILFHTLRRAPGEEPVRPAALLNLQSAAVVAAWMLYFGIRFYLTSAYHLHTVAGAAGLKTLLQFRQLHVIHIGLWGALEAGWIFPPLALTALWQRRERWLALLWAGSMGVSILVAAMVQDITRSASYLIGSLLLSWLILARGDRGMTKHHPGPARRLFAVAAAVSLLMLNYRVFGVPTTPVPLPLEAAKTVYLLRHTSPPEDAPLPPSPAP